MAPLTDRIEKALGKQDPEEVTVLSSLIRVQDEIGYLPPESVPMVAEFTGASVNDIFGVATFYTHFRFSPPGEHTIEVCWGPSCHLRGAPELLEAVQQELGLKEEGTTLDSKFTWKRSTCAGACSHGPVMALDDRIYGRLTVERARELIHRANGRR
ncbi:MAG: NAD(P)H-dependent oxidoreductase subunit E [Dehalococcoidia bacterium]